MTSVLLDLLAWCSSDGMKISELSEKMSSPGSLEVIVSGEGVNMDTVKKLDSVEGEQVSTEFDLVSGTLYHLQSPPPGIIMVAGILSN